MPQIKERAEKPTFGGLSVVCYGSGYYSNCFIRKTELFNISAERSAEAFAWHTVSVTGLIML